MGSFWSTEVGGRGLLVDRLLRRPGAGPDDPAGQRAARRSKGQPSSAFFAVTHHPPLSPLLPLPSSFAYDLAPCLVSLSSLLWAQSGMGGERLCSDERCPSSTTEVRPGPVAPFRIPVVASELKTGFSHDCRPHDHRLRRPRCPFPDQRERGWHGRHGALFLLVVG